MDDFSGKFCNQGSYPLIKNSMSLLMDYLPEWYSSNVNKKEKIMLKNSRIQTSVNANVFYVLKEEVNLLDESDADFELVKQNRIRNDLLLLLSQQPEKFFSLSLSESFNCAYKKKGLYRDPLDCSKYYYCDEKSINGKEKTKALKCQANHFFDLESCSCLKKASFTKCEHLIETYCDLTKFKKL